MRLGLLAILVGALYLLKNLDFISGVQWSILWPIILIYLGIAMVTRHRCWYCRVWHDGIPTESKRSSTCEGCGECAGK